MNLREAKKIAGQWESAGIQFFDFENPAAMSGPIPSIAYPDQATQDQYHSAIIEKSAAVFRAKQPKKVSSTHRRVRCRICKSGSGCRTRLNSFARP